MAIAIDREEAGDINNPSLDVINWCINQHKTEIPRLQMLFDYYNGNPHKAGEPTPVQKPQDKEEIYVNNAKYVTDLMVGFSVGSPIAYSAGKDKNIDPVIEAMNNMRINKHDKELAKDISVYGIGLELQYLALDPKTNKKTVPKIASIDPRGMFVVVDDTVDRNKLFAVRYREKRTIKGDIVWEINVYTNQGIITYKSKQRELTPAYIIDTDYKNHFYSEVPVTEYRNNEEKQGDYEQQLSQIDKYNKLQNDRLVDKDNFVKAIMILYGFELPEVRPGDINGNMVLNAPAKEDGGDAEYLTNTFTESEVQVLADSILDDFHKSSYVPNLNDEKFSGNVSGEAMKYKLFGLLLVLSTKIGYMEDGLIERLRLLSNMLKVKGIDSDVEGTKITFKPNLPINRSDVIQQIRDSQEFIPLLVSLGWLDDVDDPKEVVEMLNQQKDEDIKRNQGVFGVQRSHNDVIEEEEDDINNNAEESTA